MELYMIWIGITVEPEPNTPTIVSLLFVQEPPVKETWWKSWSFSSDASNEMKAIPGFFENSSIEFVKGRDGLTEFRIFFKE